MTKANEEINKLAENYILSEEEVLKVYETVAEDGFTNGAILGLTSTILHSATVRGRTLTEALDQYKLAQHEVHSRIMFNIPESDLEYSLKETFLTNMEENIGLFGDMVVPLSEVSGREYGKHIARYNGN